MSEANIHVSGLNFIEQLQMSSQMECGSEKRPYLVGVSEETRQAFLIRPTCKMWSCPACAARKARRWTARIINHINHSDSAWYFATITAHENWHSPRGSLKNIRQGWKRLYNRMRYSFGTNDYAKVWERHKSGAYHLHALIDDRDDIRWIEDYPPIYGHIYPRWLKDNARECGMGYQTKLKRVHNAGQVAGYIAKYMLKSEEVGGYAPGLRRIEVSRTWSKLDRLTPENGLLWHVQETREGQILRAGKYHSRGFEIIDRTRE